MKKIFPLIFIFFITISFFVTLFYPQSQIFSTPKFEQDDTWQVSLPVKDFLSASLKKGEWPLWNPFIGNGIPSLAEGQTAVFFLPNLLFFRFLPTITAYNLNLILAFFLASVGTYLFLKELKMSNCSAVFGALVFTFSGYLSVHLNNLNYIQACCLLPLLFASFYFLFKKPSLKTSLLPAFILSQQIFTCNFQVVFITLVGIFLLWLFLFFNNFAKKLKLLLARKLSYLILVFSLTFSLSTIQLFPTLELFLISERKYGFSFESVTSFPFPPSNLLNFIDPYAFGNPAKGTYPDYSRDWGLFWENTAYVGLAPLAASLISLLFIKAKIVQLGYFILLISILLVLGKYSPFYFLYSLPPFSYFPIPAKFLLLTTISLSILSAYTLDKIVKKIKSANIKANKFSFFGKYKQIFILMVRLIFFLLLLIDEFKFSYNYPTRIPAADWITPSESIKYISEEKDKIINIGTLVFWNSIYPKTDWRNKDFFLYFRNSLYPNYNLFFNIASADLNLDGLLPIRQARMNNLLKEIYLKENKKEISLSNTSSNSLSLVGVKYLISPYKISAENYQEIAKITPDKETIKNNFYLYKNMKAFPNSYLAFRTKLANTYEDLLRILSNPDFAEKMTPIVEEEAYKLQGENNIKEIQNQSHSSTEAVFKTEETTDCLLIFADANYSGWEATIDNNPAKLVNANLIQKAVLVPKGKHQIRFYFHSSAFETGKRITIYSWLVIFSAVFLSRIWLFHKAVEKKKLSTHPGNKTGNFL